MVPEHPSDLDPCSDLLASVFIACRFGESSSRKNETHFPRSIFVKNNQLKSSKTQIPLSSLGAMCNYMCNSPSKLVLGALGFCHGDSCARVRYARFINMFINKLVREMWVHELVYDTSMARSASGTPAASPLTSNQT